ncbi:hypothetical protein BZG01_03180 [Labilibaculum manganireducens]|uniref:Uncharacterized protein n=1 Tax=Labilibaculum manganireducens TaxID=1940525 RepID=A0A2N3IEL7_9BACT|nr:hypothetical protein BZG01_03180 [Labilibaculum manganireducens]
MREPAPSPSGEGWGEVRKSSKKYQVTRKKSAADPLPRALARGYKEQGQDSKFQGTRNKDKVESKQKRELQPSNCHVL